MKKTYIKAFTLVEMVVVVTIISILSTISMISFNWYMKLTRDSKRTTDLESYKMSLKNEKLRNWVYPTPWNYITFTNSWIDFSYQWYMDNSVKFNSSSNIALDPDTQKSYLYSITSNRQFFQIAATLESWENLPYKTTTYYKQNTALNIWDYKPLFLSLTPSIIIASNTGWSISWFNSKAILNWWIYNLPYDMDWNYFISNLPAWMTATWLINDPSIALLWNNEFNSCSWIVNAGRNMWDWYYSISTWWLLKVNYCDMP